MQNKKVQFITQSAMIAALYVVLTLFSNLFSLASSVIQVRFSEALTILPFFTPAAIPGLFIGCLISNILAGCIPADIIFGSIATLLGAFGTYALRRYRFAAAIPPIFFNTLIIPFILAYFYKFEGSLPYFMVTVGLGELISCGILGTFLLITLQKYRHIIFPNNQ